MLENENLVTEVTENVEQPTEETQVVETPPEKTYTQSELNEILGKRLARNSAKIRKEYDKKYGELEDVLRAGTGIESVDEMKNSFAKFYEDKGITIPKKPIYSDKDIEILAQAEAADVINSGYDEVVDEIDRLTELGFDNMTARDKAYFKVLAEHRQKTERQGELSKIGVTEEEANSKEFQEFASMFNPNVPIAKVYEQYNKTKPKKDIKPMGSMKNTTADNTVKDFYTVEEARQFTKADYDKDPALFRAVQQSMLKWK